MPKRKTRKHKRPFRRLEDLDWDIRSTIYKHKFRYYWGQPMRQLGGARIKCRKDYTVVEANGFRYPVTCEEIDSKTLLINGGNKRPCFGVFILSNSGEAELHDFVRSDTCSLDTGATTQTAGKAAFKVSKDYGVKHILLTDNSNRLLPSGKKFNLSLMYFLTSGRTWYESFLPIYPDPSFATSFNQWRNTVATNTWDQVQTCLRKYYTEVIIPVSIDNIDTSAPGSAMEVFRRIKDARTDFFADYGTNLANCSGIGDPQGKVWHADL
jgi:hypothetical protein